MSLELSELGLRRIQTMSKKPNYATHFVWSLLIGSYLLVAITCGRAAQTDADSEAVLVIANKHWSELSKISGFKGVGVGKCDGVPCIKVFVKKKDQILQRIEPEELDGVPVRLSDVAYDEVLTVQEKYGEKLISIPGVIGHGIGDCDGEFCIQVLLKEESAKTRRKIPKELDNIKVRVIVTGPIVPDSIDSDYGFRGHK